MRYLLFILSVFISAEIFAQTPFDGKIIYNLTSSTKKDNAELSVFFHQKGIRLEFVEKKEPDKQQEIIIINFDSGKIFTLKPADKEYKEALLKKKVIRTLPDSKDFVGYTTSPTVLFPNGISGSIVSALEDAVVYPANDLIYIVPEIYKNNPELMMIYKGHVVLAAEYTMPDYSGQWNLNRTIGWENQRDTIKATATLIFRKKMDSSLFVLPPDYIKIPKPDYLDSFDKVDRSLDSFSNMTMDTTAFMKLPIQKPVIKKKTKPTPKKNTITKQNAIRRKDE